MASARRFLCLMIAAVLATAVVLCTTTAAASGPDDDPGMPMAVRHRCWMASVGRTYADAAVKARRFEVFKANAGRVDSANRAGNLTYTLGLTPFADLTADEFRSMHLMPDVVGFEELTPAATARKLIDGSHGKPKEPDPPAAWDWRTLGAVTEVKDQNLNQKHCNSCWAFAAVAATEGLLKNAAGKLTPLSAQQVLDCTGGDNTCKGGHILEALRYIASVGGQLSTDSGYPYVGVRGTCSPVGAGGVTAIVRGARKVTSHDKDALRAAVARQPVAADMDSSDHDFQFYKGGVFRGSSSCGKKRNHAVAVVGYGTASDGTKYWLLKNSWGASWGEGGYMRIAVDADCAVSDRPAYPFV